MPSLAYFSAFCLASLRMSSATWRSRSSSGTVLGTEAPIEARTRFDTTDDNDDLDMVVGGISKGEIGGCWPNWDTGGYLGLFTLRRRMFGMRDDLSAGSGFRRTWSPTTSRPLQPPEATTPRIPKHFSTLTLVAGLLWQPCTRLNRAILGSRSLPPSCIDSGQCCSVVCFCSPPFTTSPTSQS